MANAKRAYLILYNAVSAILWTTVLGRVIATVYVKGWPFVPLTTEVFARWTQTLMAVEVAHAFLGVVRTPFPLGVFAQVFSRYFLVWFIAWPFQRMVASTPFYASMLTAWSLAEVIRYTYFSLALSGWEPYALTWARFSAFFVLYPVGISSEVVLICKAILGPAAPEVGEWYRLLLIVIGLFWVPFSPILYTHMMKQRKKALAKWKAARSGEPKKDL